MTEYKLEMTIVDNVTHLNQFYCTCQVAFKTRPELDAHISAELKKSGQMTL